MTLIYAVLVAAQAQVVGGAAGWEAAVDSLVQHRQFSGVVLVARNGVPLTERAYGMADREAGRANDLETAFNVGSINKFFTQIAIRQLAAQGKLDIDSSLGRAWPDYPNSAARGVTIRQILEHSSGIQGNIFAAPPGKTRHDVRTLADYFELFKNEPLEFAPGTRQQYSNAGYIVLGLLIERLSGQGYYDYVREHIFVPAGMTRTASWFVDSLPPNTAIGYTRGGEAAPPDAPVTRNTDFLPGRGSSAGGGYSTAHDLLRLLNALRAHKIDQAPEPGMVGIAGGAPGLNAAMEGDLRGGYDVIVLANLDPPAAGQVSRLIRQSLGLAPPEPGRRRNP
jgi:CubicO group peptidase (beta-lactamase class C family)